MEAALVSVATGVLKPVIGKLTVLLGNEYKRFKTVRKEIKSLTNELAAMEAFLLKMSENEDPDVQDKVWMNEVRELSYDLEDAIDDFMQSIGDKDEKPDGFIKKIKSSLGKLGKMKARRRIGREIQDLKKQIIEVGNMNARYRTGVAISNSKNATVDPRALAIFVDASKLVGIDEPKAEVIKLLTEEDVRSIVQQQQLQQPKIVSIVGPGGMGKTTLANQVYQELKGQFKCHAFVSVSRNPDMMTIMRTILSEVSNQRYVDTEVGSMQQLISKIKDFLVDKRYFIVVDDIWNEISWAVIKQALPKTSFGSKIITTTRMKYVALSCHSSFGGHVYSINPLSMAHSRQLFYRRLFNSEENCPSYLKEVSEQILIKCDGLPLAIIAISGLLSNKNRTKHIWNQVKDSIGRALERNPSVEGMMKILSLSYFDLPPHLKTCFLYLSLFPEDYVIGKNDLIRKWIAEGLIYTEGGCPVHELGERCFNELINRSLIQPVKTMETMPRQHRLVWRWIAEGFSCTEGEHTEQCDEINWSSNQPLNRCKYDKVIGCRVHDTILDFIISKSVEENFVTLCCVPNLHVAAERKVRRLSIQANKQGNSILPTGLVLSHTRSLYVFGYTEEIPCLDELRHLHVLDFSHCFKLENHHLENIGRLFLLRYMNLKCTRISELPEQIGHAQCLEVLDLRETNIRELPATIVNLGKLVHLLTDGDVKFPDGIGRMQALEILKKVSVLKQTLTFMQELGKLQNLRKLALSFHCDPATGDINEVDEGCKKALISSLFILGTKNLSSLAICNGGSFLEQGPLCPTPLSLQKLMTYVSVLPQVPQWVGSLVNLHQLCLQVEAIAENDLCILGGLQTLLILDLVVMSKTTDRRLIICGGVGFPCLKLFCIHHADEGGIDVMFARGAMPRLEKLEIRFNAYRSGAVVTGGAFYLGINNLPCLIAVICQVYGNSQAAETAMKRAVSMHPNRPILHFEPFYPSLRPPKHAGHTYAVSRFIADL